MTTELTCIRCPLGCALKVEVNGGSVSVTGNSCPRGAEYGAKEVTAPVRVVTGSVRVDGGDMPLVSVKTLSDVPKDMTGQVIEAIKRCRVMAPVSTGDVLIRDAAGTGADIVATRDVKSRS